MFGAKLLLMGAVLWTAPVACQATQPLAVPTPLPTATPTPAGPRPSGTQLEPVFGAIEALRTVQSQRQRIAVDGEDPETKAYGTATTRYLTLGGVEYAVHWDDTTRYAGLKVGDTVNLHPTRDLACFEGAVPDCRRLVHVYPGNRFIPPLDFI